MPLCWSRERTPWAHKYADETLGYVATQGQNLMADLLQVWDRNLERTDFNGAVDPKGLHFAFGQDEPGFAQAAGGGAGARARAQLRDKHAARFVEPGALRAFALSLAHAAHVASAPSLHAASPHWPAGWNNSMGKIYGAAHADAGELARTSESFALSISIALRVARAFVAGAGSDDSVASFGAAASVAIDAARRHTQLGRLAVARQLELDASQAIDNSDVDAAQPLARMLALVNTMRAALDVNGVTIQPSEWPPKQDGQQNPQHVNRPLLHAGKEPKCENTAVLQLCGRDTCRRETTRANLARPLCSDGWCIECSTASRSGGNAELC